MHHTRSFGFPAMLLLAACAAGCAGLPSTPPTGRTLHVAIDGDDAHDGTETRRLRTISAAARLARPGDTITVHAGTYRERITPPRGGTSDARRITYQAAPGAQVEIKGSEVVRNWTKVGGDVWQAVLPNTFFGAFNPYHEVIRGDWFDPRGRVHHPGAVYLNGAWLTEAAKREDVLAPGPARGTGGGGYLLNVAWLQPAGAAARRPAAGYAAQEGVQKAPASEGGECIGWIEDGDWVRYDGVDFGTGAARIEIRAASETRGGHIELRLGAPDGELIGTCTVPSTGGWQTWTTVAAPIKPVRGVQSLCLVFHSPPVTGALPRLWFAEVDQRNTTIWAQFPGVNPNEQLVEINVRQTVFYPDRPGINYLTVRGFTLQHAATPWAPPTAEQIALIGTHWSKGWIIESNTVSHSACSGISLGKYGDPWDNTSADTAEGYVLTIERALTNGWNKATVGSHIVRHNTISHCEQAGIVGSLGAIFSSIHDNTIHDIHVRRLFSGAEMAGIKIHAAIDCDIRRNHIYRTVRALWLDWMAQGTRVTGNLFHDSASEDLFIEVNHGPFLVDNNILLSPTSLQDWSEGGAYVHNLMAGRIVCWPQGRKTPFHPAHDTAVSGLMNIVGGDNRFFNNVFIGTSLGTYDARPQPLATSGNVYYRGGRPYCQEAGFVVRPDFDPAPKLALEGAKATLSLTLDDAIRHPRTIPVDSAALGATLVSRQGFVNPDGTPLAVDRDFFGKPRDRKQPTAGPFEKPGTGALVLPLR